MKLLGLTLETTHFEDYLSFLTEVLELELSSLDEDSMTLSLQGNTVEIRKSAHAPQHKNLLIRFALDHDEYESLVNKISFFHYRKGQSSFQVEILESKLCRLIDPDGRAWCFSHTMTKFPPSPEVNL
jgi:catechol-2,3-dioxygenase